MAVLSLLATGTDPNGPTLAPYVVIHPYRR
jgi:hypothetical protein